MPSFIPIVYHRSRLAKPIDHPAVCVPLYKMFNKKTGIPRYRDRDELCRSFNIRGDAAIVLTGTEKDQLLERWWALEGPGRRSLIHSFRKIGIDLVTVPNYSLFTDRPRWDDIHAMNRIAIAHKEFLEEGVPAALHVNGRTERDFERWAKFVNDRPEIFAISYEFGTGAGLRNRRDQHVSWLCELARYVQRPITLYVRGGMVMLPKLAESFSSVSLLDTNAFLKATYRKKAESSATGSIEWVKQATEYEHPIDDIFHHNIREIWSAVNKKMDWI